MCLLLITVYSGTSLIWTLLGQTDRSEVSSFQRLLSIQMWHLGQMNVSCYGGVPLIQTERVSLMLCFVMCIQRNL